MSKKAQDEIPEELQSSTRQSNDSVKIILNKIRTARLLNNFLNTILQIFESVFISV